MKYSKVMKERIRRVTVLFKELGYTIPEWEEQDQVYSALFEDQGDRLGLFFINEKNKFLEIAYTFSFTPDMNNFLRDHVEDILKICYRYGCYSLLQADDKEIAFSIFTKIYYAGLNYYGLRDAVKDFRSCVNLINEHLGLDD